jgi:hypothetical protein
MKRYIINSVLIAAFLFLNGLAVHRIVAFTGIYPFDNILVGNVFVYGTGMLSKSDLYNYRIESINGEKVDEENVYKIIKKITGYSVDVVLNRDGNSSRIKI